MWSPLGRAESSGESDGTTCTPLSLQAQIRGQGRARLKSMSRGSLEGALVPGTGREKMEMIEIM